MILHSEALLQDKKWKKGKQGCKSDGWVLKDIKAHSIMPNRGVGTGIMWVSMQIMQCQMEASYQDKVVKVVYTAVSLSQYEK